MLGIAGLNVTIGRPVLAGIDLAVRAGEMLALVGVSGSGKTTLARAIPLLLPPAAEVTGSIRLDGREILGSDAAARRRVRGGVVGYVFQDALAALNPAHRVGAQVAEPFRLHTGATPTAAWRHAERLLAEMDLPTRAARAYPHELSGGQRQRAMIATALSAGPRLLIADEPTSGLDPENTRLILEILAARRQQGTAVLFITHDLSLVETHADAVQVLDRGGCVERAEARAFFANPRHAVSRAMLAAARPEPAIPALAGAELLHARGVCTQYPARWMGRSPPPLSFADFSLHRGECLGVIGPSGSGKTTLGRALLGMVPYRGRIELGGTDLARSPRTRRRIQPVFQDPGQSLSPHLNVAALLAEPMQLAGIARAEWQSRAAALLWRVGLPPALLNRLPATLSGGEAQRVALARALASDPEVIVLDEPASALDVIARAVLLGVLRELLAAGTALVLISHDAAAVRSTAHRVLRLEPA